MGKNTTKISFWWASFLLFNLLFLGVVGLPQHGGEADVELLDDGGVQAVEVEQQHKLVVETYDVMESDRVRHRRAHTHTSQTGDVVN